MVKKIIKYLLGICCYLGITLLIPVIVVKNDDKWLKFHIGQGCRLWILKILLSIAMAIGFRLVGLSEDSEIIKIIICMVIYGTVTLITTAYKIIGIVYVFLNKLTPLPLIGKIRLKD